MIDSDLIRLLLETGYLAGGYGFFAESETIFEGLRAVRAESELPLVGLAVTYMNAHRHQDAIDLLRDRALPGHPGNLTVKAFLGMALKLAGFNGESERLLCEVAGNGGDGPPAAMARELLAEIRS